MNQKLVKATEKYKKADMRSEWCDCLYWLAKEDTVEARPLILEFRKRVTADAKAGRNVEQNLEWAKKSYLYAAPGNFDDYMMYIEWDRDIDKKFWLPRRSILLPVVKDIQNLVDGELDLLSISLPPGTGKLL